MIIRFILSNRWLNVLYKIVKYLKEHLLLYSFLIALFFTIGIFMSVALITTFFLYLGKVFGGGAVFSTILLLSAFFWCWMEFYKRL